MKQTILFVILLALTGCASAYVWVDTEDCVQRVNLDGIPLGKCRKVEIKK